MHKRDFLRCDANWFLNKQSAENRWEGLGRLLVLGTTCARTAQARDTELGIASLDKTVRSSSQNVAGIRVAPGTES